MFTPPVCPSNSLKTCSLNNKLPPSTVSKLLFLCKNLLNEKIRKEKQTNNRKQIKEKILIRAKKPAKLQEPSPGSCCSMLS